VLRSHDQLIVEGLTDTTTPNASPSGPGEAKFSVRWTLMLATPASLGRARCPPNGASW